MLEIRCTGTPYEIGNQHGTQAKDKVAGSISFYKDLFQATCDLDWAEVSQQASTYVESLQKLCPRYVEEIQGLADGAGVQFLDVLALNVRTEIMFGLFTHDPSLDIKSDGCTSLACQNPSGTMLLAQNWDWQVRQAANLFVCHISQPDTSLPNIAMVTEGGVIGKIGLNSSGVGVCLNAIRARGLDPSKLPVHLALRTALESKSRAAAIEQINAAGIAGSAHILLSDEFGATGLECTSIGIKEIQMDGDGSIVHANHLVLEHPGVDEPVWLPDSPHRTARIDKLLKGKASSSPITASSLFELFKDEQGFPEAINRCQVGTSDVETLFNIIMDLGEKKAIVSVGRPTEYTQRIELSF
ncbi:acyl-coenzyme A:6-aminopenicillanic acid acyl-transferase-domain-containing protein [Dactylonectria estremocensis]|uniref:Acyl-coenzyme A:6-aminopenicillanic acid acyl-transferase-domain-containing protein n=1 Tax=Dactylonectria estremocensis TaxID=1079267 RepID=A0A9P9ELE7_9HYPO|nr:acyl-coenzyme A:6-aminopenicillanic acid acyl-transferase-domain-containing protein [Dactylonectria estremocensis]